MSRVYNRFIYGSLALLYGVLTSLGVYFLFKDSREQKRLINGLEDRLSSEVSFSLAQHGRIKELESELLLQRKFIDEERAMIERHQASIKDIYDSMSCSNNRTNDLYDLLSANKLLVDQQMQVLQERVNEDSAKHSEDFERLQRCLSFLGGLGRVYDKSLSDLRTAISSNNAELSSQVSTLNNDISSLETHVNACLERNVNEMYSSMISPTVRISCGMEVGSGTIVYSKLDGDGLIHNYAFTALHVVSENFSSKASPISVVNFDRFGNESQSFSAKLIDVNEKDLALIEFVSDDVLPHASLMPRSRVGELEVFDSVYALGCPLGYAVMPSFGELSSKSKALGGENYWMINAPTIFGNSGGGIYYAETSELIGVLTRVSAYNNFINIAVPHMGILVPIHDVYSWLEESRLQFIYDPSISRIDCLREHRKHVQRLNEAISDPTSVRAILR